MSKISKQLTFVNHQVRPKILFPYSFSGTSFNMQNDNFLNLEMERSSVMILHFIL